MYKYLVHPPSTLVLSIFSPSKQPPPVSSIMSFFAHCINPSFTVVLFQYATGDPEMGFFVSGDQSGSLETGTQHRMAHRPYTGPHSMPMEIYRQLIEGNRSTANALTCHAWGDEMPHSVQHARRIRAVASHYGTMFNNTFSNCILNGRGTSCEWRTQYDLNSDEEYDYQPPVRAVRGDPGASATRTAGRGDRPVRKRRRTGGTSRSNAEPQAEEMARYVIDITGDE
jgi:hypothetical protein